MDDIFGGVVENGVYDKNPKKENESKDSIHDTFAEIDKDRNLCRTVRASWRALRNVATLKEDILSTRYQTVYAKCLKQAYMLK